MEINLFNYYGLDWLSMLLSFYGMWLLGKKRKAGFIFTALGMISALSVALLAQQYGFIFANIIMMILSARNYIIWRAEEKTKYASVAQGTEQSTSNAKAADSNSARGTNTCIIETLTTKENQ